MRNMSAVPFLPLDTSFVTMANLDFSALFLLAATICAFLIPIAIILPPVSPQKSDALLQTHTKAGLPQSKSNLKDQFAAELNARDSSSSPRVQALMIHPVKSCKGFEVSRSRVLPHGLEYDRLFTFAQLKSPFPLPANPAAGDGEAPEKVPSWDFITLRQFPALATVAVELWLPDEMKLRKQSLRSREAFLILRFPWREPGWRGAVAYLAAKLTKGPGGEPEMEVLLPVEFPSQDEIKDRDYVFEEVTIWKQPVRALNMGSELPGELRRYLGVSNKLSLFRIDPESLREVDEAKASASGAGVMGFQDAYPLNLMSISSVLDLSGKVPKDDSLKVLDVRRFRPNIIVAGAEPYDEETWKKVRLNSGTSGLYNSAEVSISCRCTRCKLPNVDPDTGVRHPVEPDRSLRKLRNVDEGAPRHGCLGMQALPLFEEGLEGDERRWWVGVGMSVEVLERGRHSLAANK